MTITDNLLSDKKKYKRHLAVSGISLTRFGVAMARHLAVTKCSMTLLPAGVGPRRPRTRQRRSGGAKDYSALSLPGAALMLIGLLGGGAANSA